MVSGLPSIRELIAKVGPRQVNPPLLSMANWLLWGAAGFCLLTILIGGLLLLQPSLKSSLLMPAIVSNIIGLGLFIGWGVLNLLAFGNLLWRSNALLADQLDAQIAHDRELIDDLAKRGAISDLQRLGRRVAFEAKVVDSFGTTVAIVGGLGAAITTTAAALPIDTLQLGQLLKIAIPALLLGSAIGGALKHGFGQRLLRLGFVISEAERMKAEGATECEAR
jgi:hypothetical protein